MKALLLSSDDAEHEIDITGDGVLAEYVIHGLTGDQEVDKQYRRAIRRVEHMPPHETTHAIYVEWDIQDSWPPAQAVIDRAEEKSRTWFPPFV